MDKLARTQLSTLASYGSPFVLILAIVLNASLSLSGLASSPFRFLILSFSIPIGFSIGRIIYLRKSHVEILLDDVGFQVFRGRSQTAKGTWRDYRFVSIILDQFARPNLRLYRTLGGDFIDLPISKTNAKPQEFRNHVQKLLAEKDTSSLRFAEVA